MQVTPKRMEVALKRHERCSGCGRQFTLEEVGQQVGLSIPRVHNLEREVRHELDRIEVELLKLCAPGTDEVFAYLIPHQDQTTRQLGIDFFDLICREMRSRGFEFKVEHRATPDGSAFFIADVTIKNRSHD